MFSNGTHTTDCERSKRGDPAQFWYGAFQVHNTGYLGMPRVLIYDRADIYNHPFLVDYPVHIFIY